MDPVIEVHSISGWATVRFAPATSAQETSTSSLPA
jgi:hypothetical protein